jgi:broad specificity phosphatase PhoE
MLLRHGESVSSTLSSGDLCPADCDNPLTKLGREQLERIATESSFPLASPVIISSPVRRAAESADIIAARHKSEVIFWKELREIFDVENATKKEAIHRLILDFWSEFYMGNDSDRMEMVQYRQAHWVLKQLQDKFDPESEVLLISHGGKIELLTAIILGIGACLDRTIQFTPDCGRYHLFNMQIEKGRFAHTTVLGLNH